MLSVRFDSAVEGVPIVCLPIWHWYMFRGLWLKSEYCVMLETTLSMLVGSNSTWVDTPFSTSSGVHAISMYTCSNVPTWSRLLFSRYVTGRIIRLRSLNRYRPGYWPPLLTGT